MKLFLSLAQEAFQNFGTSLGGQVTGNTLSINNSFVQGSGYFVTSEEGLRIFIFNFLFKAKFNFSTAIETKSDAPAYMALYCFPFDGLSFLQEEKHFQLNAPSFMLANNKEVTRIVCSKGSSLKGIAAVFTQDWYTNHSLHLHSLSRRQLSKAEEVLVRNIFYLQEHGYPLLEIKGSLFTLLSFLDQHAVTQSHDNTPSRYTPVMMKVARRISSSLYKPMPSLEELATEFFISPSTLKRQFKTVFGIGVYEYYLSKKMELAKTMLETGKEKVSAVAFCLGYENPSHFISSFKKIYGYSPGRLKNNGA